jgi:hypothetical protein
MVTFTKTLSSAQDAYVTIIRHIWKLGLLERNAYRILAGKPEGKPRCRWEDNIGCLKKMLYNFEMVYVYTFIQRTCTVF